MTESGDARTRGRPVGAVLAVAWVGLGFSAIEVGDTWRGAAGVLLGTLSFAAYLWPDSAVDRMLGRPALGRKK